MGGGRRAGTDTRVDAVDGGPLEWVTQGLFPENCLWGVDPENCLWGVDQPLEEPTGAVSYPDALI